jgi:hypothetical protein
MSDGAEGSTTDTGTQEVDVQPGTGEGDVQDEVGKWKAMSRKHEAQAKANAAAAKRLAEIEEANKTEAEKTQSRLSEAEERAAKAESQLMRIEIAAAKGLTPKQAGRLVGTTREELEADADELLKDFAVTGKDEKPAAKPDFGGGRRGADIPLNGDPLMRDLKSKLNIP